MINLNASEWDWIEVRDYSHLGRANRDGYVKERRHECFCSLTLQARKGNTSIRKKNIEAVMILFCITFPSIGIRLMGATWPVSWRGNPNGVAAMPASDPLSSIPDLQI
ncbi:hypothetical protein L6452_08442 [Arctium lappa]|uniref:Uncharacterized protein n=1 Tax=Arctium lappa TaxID=4217 RepID=A0ACB9DHL9_ARCLA|nr:hypothetical protein L6452_08442 [Arctium lappa]